MNTRLLRQISLALLNSLGIADFELGIHLVGKSEMGQINSQFLQHEGSTDVITFDHSALGARRDGLALHGEIFICLDEAVAQARQFRTSWQSELVRYLVHGVLHLLGHDDLDPVARRKMKREENRFVRKLSARFPLSKLARTSKL